MDSNLPLAELHTLDYYYLKSMARTSFTLVMLSLAGGMALLLGIVGLYGVIAYSVSQRTHELGIRMALGAQKRDVLRLILTQGMRLTLIGVGIGIGSAFVLTHFLSSLLYDIKPKRSIDVCRSRPASHSSGLARQHSGLAGNQSRSHGSAQV